MNCIEHKEQANLFIDGELESRQQMELFKHLAECTDCQSFVDAIVRTKEASRREQIQYPADIDETLFSKIASRKITSSRNEQHSHARTIFWRRRVTLPAPLFAAAVIVVLVFGLFLGDILTRKSETQTFPSSWLQTQTQPATIIMIYGVPPVEVFGKPLVQTKSNIRYQN